MFFRIPRERALNMSIEQFWAEKATTHYLAQNEELFNPNGMFH